MITRPCRFAVCRRVVTIFSVLAVSQCYARILHTRIAPSQTWDPWFPLTLGSGVEFETDAERSQIEFPMLLEYNFTRTLKLTLEPDVIYIVPKTNGARRIAAFDDLETSVEYEFVSERRYRPGLTAIGSIKWPTATDSDVGRRGRDYSFGLIASKDLVFVDVDLGALYTFVGDRQERNTLEISAAADWHLNHFFDVEAEVVRTFGGGGEIRGRPGSISGIGSGGSGTDVTEGTLGLAWHVTKRLKLEQGGILRSDGTWQIVFAWEFSLSGD